MNSLQKESNVPKSCMKAIFYDILRQSVTPRIKKTASLSDKLSIPGCCHLASRQRGGSPPNECPE